MSKRKGFTLVELLVVIAIMRLRLFVGQLEQLSARVTSASSRFVCSPKALTLPVVLSALEHSIVFVTAFLIGILGFLIVLSRTSFQATCFVQLLPA